jgi:hypothetical protein
MATVRGPGEFGRRLTDAQLRAVAEALAPFWHDEDAVTDGQAGRVTIRRVSGIVVAVIRGVA